jgi:ribonuclease HI
MGAAREPVLDENALNIFTDGSSYSSPRRGGCAFRIKSLGTDGYWVDHDEQLYGVAGGTNQEMELLAVIEALNSITGRRSQYDLRDYSKVVVYTDSRYVVDNINSALYTWRTTGWHDRDGNPIVNAVLWKKLVKAIHDVQPKRLYFEWVKGHKASSDNKAVDRMAQASAKGPLRGSLKVERSRRKLTDKKTEPGSIPCLGQRITVRIVGDQWLDEQKVTRYRCEVVSKKSPYFGNMDWLFSQEILRANHTYHVRLSDDPTHRWIVKLLHEVKPKEPESNA